jgi:hypothetical protein
MPAASVGLNCRATIVAISTLGTALAALLSDEAPSRAAREQRARRRRQTQSETIANLFASGVRHTSVTKTGGKVREQLVIHLDEPATVTNLTVYHHLGRVHSTRCGDRQPGLVVDGRTFAWTRTGHNIRG